MASANGDAVNGASNVSSTQRSLTQKEIVDAFHNVPWMEFGITAKPNLKVFTAHPAVRQVVADVAHSTVKHFTEQLTENIMHAIESAVNKVFKDASDAVPGQLAANIEQAFKGLTVAPDVTLHTGYQSLKRLVAASNLAKDTGHSAEDPESSTDGVASMSTVNNLPGESKNQTVIVAEPAPVIPGPTPITDLDLIPPHAVADPDISTSHWIWTPEHAHTHAPGGGARAFRKTVHLQEGHFVDSMTIDITCDSCYTLYANGCIVGSGIAWGVVQRFRIALERTNKVVLAVYAAQDAASKQQAGLLAAGVLWDSGNFHGETYKVRTNGTWKASHATDQGFQKIGFKDRDWAVAKVEGPYGMQPWGDVPKPTSIDPIGGGFSNIPGIPDPPSAPQATAEHEIKHEKSGLEVVEGLMI